MNYTITLHNKSEYEITEEELGAILGSNGLVHIKRLGVGISKSSISNYEPTENIKKNTGSTGVLHDGTFVVRQFGQWYLQDGDRDENGKYLNVIDSSYYPEIARDCVPSPQEFEKIAHLPSEERLKALVGDRRAIGGEWKSLSSSLSEKGKEL